MGEVEEFCVAGCQWASDSENLYVFAHLADMSLNDEIYPHGACGSVHVHPLISQIARVCLHRKRKHAASRSDTVPQRHCARQRQARDVQQKKSKTLKRATSYKKSKM